MIDPLKQAEHTLVHAIAKIKAFEKFSSMEVWRLFMDGKHQDRGILGFEDEQGYMVAMMNGFTAMLQLLHVPLTNIHFEQLHDTCLTNVFTRPRPGDPAHPMELNYRDSSLLAEGFGVDNDTWSNAGYNELVFKYQCRNKGDKSYDDGKSTVGMVLLDDPKNMVGPTVDRKVMQLKPLKRSQCLGFATSILDRYTSEIQKIDPLSSVTPEDQKLKAIVRCCQDLDQVHLFKDGNIRTIVFVVLNKFLIENDLSPTILDEPNIFDCKSVEEIQVAVKAGQALFAHYKNI